MNLISQSSRFTEFLNKYAFCNVSKGNKNLRHDVYIPEPGRLSNNSGMVRLMAHYKRRYAYFYASIDDDIEAEASNAIRRRFNIKPEICYVDVWISY